MVNLRQVAGSASNAPSLLSLFSLSLLVPEHLLLSRAAASACSLASAAHNLNLLYFPHFFLIFSLSLVLCSQGLPLTIQARLDPHHSPGPLRIRPAVTSVCRIAGHSRGLNSHACSSGGGVPLGPASLHNTPGYWPTFPAAGHCLFCCGSSAALRSPSGFCLLSSL